MVINLDITDFSLGGLNYQRKLRIEGVFFRYNDDRIEIPCDIYYYYNGIELGRNLFTSNIINERTGRPNFESNKTVVFIVDNITKVDLSGNYDVNGPIGEYDYYMDLLNRMDILVQNGITSLQNGLLSLALTNAVQNGRLD